MIKRMYACEGDCDYDSHCAPGLKCKQRSGFTQIPGCSMGGKGDKKDADYCYKPTSAPYKWAKAVAPGPGHTTLLNFGGNAHVRMNLCTGDCDSDAQCATGLACFQRGG